MREQTIGRGFIPDPFRLRIGPICVELSGQCEPHHSALDAAHHRFLHHTAPDYIVHVRHESAGPPVSTVVFQAGGVASFCGSGEDWSIRVGGADLSSADRVLDLTGSAARLRLDVEQSPELSHAYPLEYPLEELLFRHLLARQRAVIVHACGVSWRGRGYLFVGSSGAGKSTTARLWRAAGATILNDDRVVLDASGDGPLIHPTPWFGEHPEVGGEAAPLSAIYLLRQGTEPGFTPVAPAAAAALLFAKSFPPVWDPEGIAGVLAALDRALQRVPCGWLTVPPDARAVGWVQAHG